MIAPREPGRYRPRSSVAAGERVRFHEDNTSVLVEVLSVEDEDGGGCTLRTFKLRALERQNEPHAVTGGVIEEGQEFEINVNLEYIDGGYAGWYFSEE